MTPDKPSLKPKSKLSFHNPYNFVPAIPRLPTDGKDLGDSQPAEHSRYLPKQWSGKIVVQIKTVTPLLIIDAANRSKTKEDVDHYCYSIRRVDDLPYIAPTTIKGMLRSSYESITNSRLSVFSDHDSPLVYRMPAINTSSSIYPAVVRHSNGKKILRIMPGYDVMGAACKLPCYKKYDGDNSEADKGENDAALLDNISGELLEHGDKVWIRLNPDNNSNHLPEEIKGFFPQSLMKNVVTCIQKRDNDFPPNEQQKWYKGIVCINGANIKEKRYERVFIEDDKNDKRILVSPEMDELWGRLINDYKEVNKKSLEKRRDTSGNHHPDEYLGHKPGQTAFSRHVYQTGSEKFALGTLCYVELDVKLQKGETQKISAKNIKAILPVAISRHFHEIAPVKLLDSSLQPASSFSELSPADRVFGWVNQAGDGSYRGNLRIHSVCCITSDPIEPLGNGLPLSILGQPQPQQGRFYVAKDDQGTPVDQGIAKKELYKEGQGLRGRKVYPHHQNLPNNYWNEPLEDRTQKYNQGTYQEYRRSQNQDGTEQQDNQNRSIAEWVKPDVTFEFKINITNLSDVELGALLWLLNLPNHHFHRLGGGKPLGFGSVIMSVNWGETDLRMGESWQQFYKSLLSPPERPEFDHEQIISKFKTAVENSYGTPNGFDEVSFIKAFCQNARGFSDGKPIHYPRTTAAPEPEGKIFEWFTENEAINKNSPPRQYPLGTLIDDPGLPTWS
jgi:CRISPR-associated protein (TIGR03986 family)